MQSGEAGSDGHSRERVHIVSSGDFRRIVQYIHGLGLYGEGGGERPSAEGGLVERQRSSKPVEQFGVWMYSCESLLERLVSFSAQPSLVDLYLHRVGGLLDSDDHHFWLGASRVPDVFSNLACI